MKVPKMILFDYGETLIHEDNFDGIKGTNAIMPYIIENEKGYTAEQIQDFANRINGEIGRYDEKRRDSVQIEVANFAFENLLYEFLGIRLRLDTLSLERIFWEAASPGHAMDGIQEFLLSLRKMDIRTGVVSNISISGSTLAARIHQILPENTFEFILASNDYIFRKPHPLFFQLALHKANLCSEDVWYCGDNPICDMDGAGSVGLFPVWYQPFFNQNGKNPTVAHLKIAHWKELKEYIEILNKNKE